MPVDRIALYEKLEKMGLSIKSVYRENHATVAVEEFVASEDRENGVQTAPGSLVLTEEEVVYMVLDFARTQGGER